MEEIWKSIPIDVLKDYEASTFGNIRHKKYKKLLKFYPTPFGHLSWCYSRKWFRKNYKVHRLIALTFLEQDIEGLVINHKNHIPYDNNISNLEAITLKENNLHGYNARSKVEILYSKEDWTKSTVEEFYLYLMKHLKKPRS